MVLWKSVMFLYIKKLSLKKLLEDFLKILKKLNILIMKKLFLSLSLGAVLLGSSAFTPREEVKDEILLVHNCTYRMYNSSGQYLGNWTLFDVPDNVACGSAQAKQVAIDSYNAFH
jgi:hypothetical protein